MTGIGIPGVGSDRDGRIGPPGVWPQFSDPRFLGLLRHWAACRNGLMAPRAAIEPAVIRDCLPHVYLMRWLPDEDDFVCSLSGEQVNEAWGQTMIGKRPRDFMPPASAVRAMDIYRLIVRLPAVHVGHRPIEPLDRPEKAAERLVVPLAHPDGSPWGFLGLSFYHYNPVTEAGHVPHIGPDVTYYPCADLPPAPP